MTKAAHDPLKVRRRTLSWPVRQGLVVAGLAWIMANLSGLPASSASDVLGRKDAQEHQVLILAYSQRNQHIASESGGASVSVATCGDSILDPGEECDDGNTSNLDGCSDDCQLEVCLITLPGDMNNSNSRTSADIITLRGYLFKGGITPLPCSAAGDVNCDGAVTMGDMIVMINFVFKGGPPPCDICSNSPLAATCT